MVHVLLAFAPSPVINTKVPYGQAILLDRFLLLNAAKNGVVNGAHGQTLENPLRRATASHVADQSHDLRGSLCLPRIDARDLGQSLAENLAWTRRIAASETADDRPELDRNTSPPQVVQPTEIATMARLRAFLTKRTDGILLNMDDEAESVSVAFDSIEDQDVRTRKKGLRMARQSLPKTKTFFIERVCEGLHQNCGRS